MSTTARSTTRFRALRRDRLLALFQELRPRVIITEMFPFGRRAFRFELVPLLEAAARARPRPWRLCSVRDVLVRKPDPAGLRLDARAGARPFRSHPGAYRSAADPVRAHLSARRGARRPPGRDRLRGRAAHGADRRRAAAKFWSPPAAAGSAQGCWRRRSTARPLSRLRARPWRLIAGGNLAGRRVPDARRPAAGRRDLGTPARRFPGAPGKQPSLRLTSRLQHCPGGAAFPQADGPGTIRDGDGDGTKNTCGASGGSWASPKSCGRAS